MKLITSAFNSDRLRLSAEDVRQLLLGATLITSGLEVRMAPLSRPQIARITDRIAQALFAAYHTGEWPEISAQVKRRWRRAASGVLMDLLKRP